MAATVTGIRPKTKANQFITVHDVNLGTYTTGGVSVAPGDLGLSKIDSAIVKFKTSSTVAVTMGALVYNISTGKVLAYGTTNAEVANSSDLSAITVRIIAFGV